MNVERRLQHAARDLREMAIDVPSLHELTGATGASPPRRTARTQPRLAALAAPMLFVAGGLLAVGVMQRAEPSPVHSDIGLATAVDAGAASANDVATADVDVPSIREELRLIRGIVDEAPEPPPGEAPSDDPVITAAGPS